MRLAGARLAVHEDGRIEPLHCSRHGRRADGVVHGRVAVARAKDVCEALPRRLALLQADAATLLRERRLAAALPTLFGFVQGPNADADTHVLR